MAVTSYVEEEGPGKGRGHTEHGNGKGLGHLKHQQDAMADGEYTIQISGVEHVNHTAAGQTSPQITLADGSKLNTFVRDGSITIDDAPGNNTGEALHLVTDSNNGTLRLNVVFDADQQVELGDLDTLNFDYYIESSSRTDVIPVIRLNIDADGDLSTAGDRGELVFEYAYQNLPATTQDSWQTANLIGDGGDWNAWQRSFGQNRDQIINIREFSDWADADGFTPTGGLNFNENSVVFGYQIALGSTNGTNNMYLDNFQFAGVTTEFLV